MPMDRAGFTAGWFGKALPEVRFLLHGRGVWRELIMTVKYRAGRRLQGLSGVGNVCVGRDILELCALLYGCAT